MNFIRALLPDDWYLKFFSPPEDNKESNPSGVYLHIRQPNVSLPLSLDNSSRYDVVSFFQKYHDNDYHQTLSQSQLLDQVNNLFSITRQENENSDQQYEELLNCFESFQQNEMVFARPSQLEIDHNPDDNEKWITIFTKSIDNGKKGVSEEVIASINAYKNYTFPDEKEVVEPKDFD